MIMKKKKKKLEKLEKRFSENDTKITMTRCFVPSNFSFIAINIRRRRNNTVFTTH